MTGKEKTSAEENWQWQIKKKNTMAMKCKYVNMSLVQSSKVSLMWRWMLDSKNEINFSTLKIFLWSTDKISSS